MTAYEPWQDQLLHDYEPLRHALAHSTAGRLDVEEITQLARIAAWQSWEAYGPQDGRSAFPTILRRRVADELRTIGRRDAEVLCGLFRDDVNPEEHPEAWSAAALALSRTSTPAEIDALLEREATRDYHRELVALAREPLSAVEDAVVVNHYLLGRAGQTDAETADRLEMDRPDLNLGRISVRYVGDVRRRALGKAREALGVTLSE